MGSLCSESPDLAWPHRELRLRVAGKTVPGSRQGVLSPEGASVSGAKVAPRDLLAHGWWVCGVDPAGHYSSGQSSQTPSSL